MKCISEYMALLHQSLSTQPRAIDPAVNAHCVTGRWLMSEANSYCTAIDIIDFKKWLTADSRHKLLRKVVPKSSRWGDKTSVVFNVPFETATRDPSEHLALSCGLSEVKLPLMWPSFLPWKQQRVRAKQLESSIKLCTQKNMFLFVAQKGSYTECKRQNHNYNINLKAQLKCHIFETSPVFYLIQEKIYLWF